MTHPHLTDWVPIRSLSSADRPALASHLLALDEHDRYLRFGHAVGDEQVLHYVEHIDFDAGEVLGIFNRKLELLAMAHLASMGPTEAEFGVSVLPQARGRGYGQRLFNHASWHARSRGVRTLVIHTLMENQAMLRIAHHAGAQIVGDSGEATARLALPAYDWSVHAAQWLDDQVAEVDYRLKAGQHRLHEWAEVVGDIRAQVIDRAGLSGTE